MDGLSNALDNFESIIASGVTGTFEDIISSNGETVLLKVKSHGLTHVSNTKETNLLLSGGGRESSSENGFAEHCIIFI